ncbi:DNA (cytosine-5)-methyltransferase 1 [Hyphodiscus hymeniophilus]|uniref:DNA (cytosine-5-)-methyltransferase n=1 Tax=Hyphodiscus hymeniophilus TaxID=353542 RepID=A0A9P6SQD5_9HELO|nr:DNA (cytosine-5)-methyltransferase 1 [Hyphodiscus hymeniophilus]
MGSTEQFYNAASTILSLSDYVDTMDTSSDSDKDVSFDITQSTEYPQQKPLNIETPESSEHNLLDPEPSTPSFLGEEGGLAGPLNFLQTSHGSRELSESSAQGFPRSHALTIPFESTLTYPKSQYNGYVPPLPICKEHIAVQEIRQALPEEEKCLEKTNESISDGEDYQEFELEDFAIYLPRASQHPYELRGLQDFASKVGHASMLFDGILRAGSHRRYVQGVPFEICSIGNYGKELHTVDGEIWIKSLFNKKSTLYYRLKAPSGEYRRYHTEFLWLAELAKHFFDYCEACEEEGRAVSVHNFREDFSQWLLNTHGESVEFRLWYGKYPGHDFRRTVSANILFLFKESIGVKDKLRKQPIWRELLEKDFIPAQAIEQYQTVVTPYVYDCFAHLRFGQHLKVVEPVLNTHHRQARQGDSLHLTVAQPSSQPIVEIPSSISHQVEIMRSASPAQVIAKDLAAERSEYERRRRIETIQVGDVISVMKDTEGSKWKDEFSRWKVSDHCWYVLVQAVHELEDSNERCFDGIWLYKPSDTSCAKMKYPYSNELFLSDNCTCKRGKTIGIIEQDSVIDVATVIWYGQPSESSKDLFVRQTYLENERFVSLKESHKNCEHFQGQKDARASENVPRYPIGQTVLVSQKKLSPPRRRSKYALDPYEIIRYEVYDLKEYAILRRLLRRHEMEGQSLCKPNELVYCHETAKVEPRKIERACLVRFYTEADLKIDTIPAPYNRDGTGNAFYITSKLARDAVNGGLAPFGEGPVSLIQGFDPSQEAARKKLEGLDLYCGGGNFGRGLEEGQAVHNRWAVDMDKIAIHTYYANLRDPQDTHLYFGSVNDQLFQALQGNPKKSKLIPQPGEVDFISAGSPCQGFSLLNNSRDEERGLKNQSMVASVAAYIDFYRPKYGLLENVLNMAQKGKERDHDVLSQLICAIVGMGYQLSTFLIDAWSYGSPQSRSRIFVAFTAPGYELIPHPELSHSHPPGIGERGLGLQANGEAFSKRRHDPTPLNFVTAGAAVRDLPYLGDGSTHTCIPFPDHVLHNGVSQDHRLRVAAIPTFPRGMNFWTAWNDGKGVMTKEQRAFFPPSTTGLGKPRQCVGRTSRAWGRVIPNHLFNTIVVTSNAHDARMGTILHWDQNRCLTVMEGRRAQSFPDEEVLVGSENQRMKIIGNSVDRSVSLSLGLSLRTAWEQNPLDSSNRQSTMVVDDAPVRSTRPLAKDKHGRFSRSANIAGSSASSPQITAGNELNELAAPRDIVLASVKSYRVFGKDRRGILANKSDEATQNIHMQSTPKYKSDENSTGTPIGDLRGKIASKNYGGSNNLPILPVQKVISSSPLYRTIRDSYDSDDDLVDPDLKDSSNSFASQPMLSPRPTNVIRSIETPESTNKSSSQAVTTKRPFSAIVLDMASPEKTLKAIKLSNTTSSSSSIDRQVEAKSSTTGTRDSSLSQPPRNNPVNASQLSEKLQVVLKQHVADEPNLGIEEESDVTDFNGFSSSEEEADDNDEIKMEIDQGDLPFLSSQPCPMEPIRLLSQVKKSRIINTSNRGNVKSPTKARHKPYFVIDLTSDAENEVAKTPPRGPTAKFPVRPAVVTPQSKYAPVGKNLLSP